MLFPMLFSHIKGEKKQSHFLDWSHILVHLQSTQRLFILCVLLHSKTEMRESQTMQAIFNYELHSTFKKSHTEDIL